MEMSPLVTRQSDSSFQYVDWGLIPYQDAMQKQLDLVEQVALEPKSKIIIFCSHPAVVTLGRQTQSKDVFSWNGDTIEVSRGGRATYHGPSQLVVYVITSLKHPKSGSPESDVRGFIRNFENCIVESLKKFDIDSFGRSNENIDDTGVWCKDQNGDIKKLASLGIAVRKWVTYHGAAINCEFDQNAFQGINPCGYSSDRMISIEELLEQNKKTYLNMKHIRAALVEHLKISIQTFF